ncbi:hypothetical protein TSUD_206270 [Trifolium subterraneum]|uniref:C2 NT-type domain-containing protein n=1 Tax=Trifolium subterraneum TaxID=3900 RepID=A0A2Z6MLQ8_TRISU|nr:hypothetical protein TSUD_206270 [Trifolium subterraneum]
MLPKIEIDGEESLKDVQTVTKTLSKNSSTSKHNDPKPDKEDTNFKKDKKSIWDWKLLRAFSLTKSKKFNCCFSLQVHLIEGLPSSFNDKSLCVHWKRRDQHFVTPPAKVVQGVAKFQDILSCTCSIVGSKSGSYNSAKYEAKHFVLYASVLGVPELDFGNHRLDITWLLPLSLEDLEEEKSSGKWSTSYRLSGKAKGAVMNVSFGYTVVGDSNTCAPNVLSSRQNCMALSKTDVNPCQYSSRVIDEVKDLHEVLTSTNSAKAGSTDVVLCKKLDGENTCSPLHKKPELVLKENLEPIKLNVFQENLETGETVEPDDFFTPESVKENYYECDGFSVVDQGVGFSSNEHNKIKESIVEAIVDSSKESTVVHEFSNKKDELYTKELLLQEIETALNCISELEKLASESPEIMEVTSESKFRKSHSLESLDDVTKSVADEFLSMLSIDDSPTGFSSERLEFEDVKRKLKGHTLEDMETEALMCEWGLNEEAFQHSPPKGYAGFGSPIHQLAEEPPRLPPLAEGFGPFLQTKDGGFLRSMNPSLFTNADSGRNLIMQISNPVVMPIEMGSGIMETLQYLASIGIEKLSVQANKFMPLEDITGKTMQQISWEAMSSLEGKDRQCMQDHLETRKGSTYVQRDLKGSSSGLKSDEFISSSICNNRDSGIFSLEDLAPLAMDKIEALSMEGLKIQSEMSEEDAPSNIIAQSFGDLPAIQAKWVNIGGSLGLDGAAALRLMNIKDSDDEVDGIMGLSLTLDEWMRLDSGEIDDIDHISEHTCKLLAAHNANTFDVVRESSNERKKQGKGHSRKCGLLGNNFTVALMVQLRDPLRNYEPVGTPMLGLIQVERVLVPPKQKIYLNVSQVGNNSDEDDDECEIRAKVEMKDKKEESSTNESGIDQFRITEVHVSGLKIQSHKKKLWDVRKTTQCCIRCEEDNVTDHW